MKAGRAVLYLRTPEKLSSRVRALSERYQSPIGEVAALAMGFGIDAAERELRRRMQMLLGEDHAGGSNADEHESDATGSVASSVAVA
ncbi:MAG: hypothetical protein KGL39_11885 [Patescibacteria group bacterium]|nr:hypothetical protein [Patescibacteria group bacterium]